MNLLSVDLTYSLKRGDASMKKLLFAILFLPFITIAEDDFQNFAIHQTYITPRSLGMGGAITAVVDDYSALFFNPAALRRLETWELNFTMGGAFTPDVLDFTGDLSDATGVGTDDSDPARINAVVDVLESYVGENFSSRFPTLSGIFAQNNFAIGIIPADPQLNLALHNSLGPQVNVEAYNDTTIAAALAGDLFSVLDNLHWGVTFKGVYRGYAGQNLIAIDLLNDDDFFQDEDIQEGFTIDTDIGFLWLPEWTEYGPALSLVIRNLLDIGFQQNFNIFNDNSTEPPRLERRFDIGSAWYFPSFWLFEPKVTFDIRDIGHSRFALLKGMHLGGELSWQAFSWLEGAYRMGINQGYFTAGLTAQFSLFRLDYATWGEEVGTSTTRIEDRRHMLTLALDI